MAQTADQIIVEDSFREFRELHYPNMDPDHAFEIFAAELVLRGKSIDHADLRRGIVGDSDDGGVDGFYIFLNESELVWSDSIRLSRRKGHEDGIQPGVALDVVLVQAKNKTNWDGDVFSKIRDVVEASLDEKTTEETLRSFPLNNDMVESILTLRQLRKKLVKFAPSVNFKVFCVTKAKQSDLQSYQQTKRNGLSKALKEKLPTGSKIVVEYVGDSEFTKLLKVSPDFIAIMKFIETPVRQKNGLVGLVKIRDYIRFLSRDNTGDIREELFSVNVRDFAGQNAHVNSAIRSTLSGNSKSVFWWLNNGITIIADDAADPEPKSWRLTNPLIVNGLQTSHVLHSSRLDEAITKKRLGESVLVRIITDSDPAVRQSIIVGTNNQTSIKSVQLHANEDIQIRIEQYLKAHKWYYERRRYQYRGMKVSASRIRNITELAQAVIAVNLLKPDTARARPTNLLDTQSGYDSVFSFKIPEPIYLKSLNIMEQVEAYLATDDAKAISEDATNSRFYVAAGYVIRSLRLKNLDEVTAARSISLLKDRPNNQQLMEVHRVLAAVADEFDDDKQARDRIFKGSAMKAEFFKRLVELNSN